MCARITVCVSTTIKHINVYQISHWRDITFEPRPLQKMGLLFVPLMHKNSEKMKHACSNIMMFILSIVLC